MSYQEELLQKVEELAVKKENRVEEEAYLEMLSQLAKELADLASEIETLKQNQGTRKQLMPYDHEWQSIMDEICEGLDVLGEESFSAVKGKKIYEMFDEVIADLEEWIETVNEALMGQNMNLSYLEAWDIGLFF